MVHVYDFIKSEPREDWKKSHIPSQVIDFFITCFNNVFANFLILYMMLSQYNELNIDLITVTLF